MQANQKILENISTAKALILIPARWASSRFEGKPLSKIQNTPMIHRVYNNCIASGFPAFVVTDDDRIQKSLESIGAQVLRVDDPVLSGSERIYLAYKRYFSESAFQGPIVNVQGDEPLLRAESIKQLIDFHLEKKAEFDVCTLVQEKEKYGEEFENRHTVKAIYCKSSRRCHYFSRSPIPYNVGVNSKWFKHIGIYSYTAEALQSFVELGPSYYESLENLEQLRFLDNGFSIGASTIDYDIQGVDTLEDLQKIAGVLSGQKY